MCRRRLSSHNISGAKDDVSCRQYSSDNTRQDRAGRFTLGESSRTLNPTGSVKDRAAARMLQLAIEKDNLLSSKKEVLDASSGNTGISLASFGVSLGVKVTIVLPKSASIERQRLLKLYGANIIFSDPMEGSDGAILVARELAGERA